MNYPISCMVLLTAWTVACLGANSRAGEPRISDLRLEAPWEEQARRDQLDRAGWEVRLFKHSGNDDLLVVAKSNQPHPRSFDDVVEFAPSGYPYWFPENEDFVINRIKTERTKEFALDGVKLESISYCVVNEYVADESTVMGQGYLVLTTSNAFYVQHTSRRPITHWQAHSLVESLLKTAALSSAGK